MTTENKGNLTNLQRELLKVFSVELSESQLLDVRTLLAKYFAEMATKEMDRLWEENDWNAETMEAWANEHRFVELL